MIKGSVIKDIKEPLVFYDDNINVLKSVQKFNNVTPLIQQRLVIGMIMKRAIDILFVHPNASEKIYQGLASKKVQ